LGEDIGESGIAILPDLLFEAHLRLQADAGRRVTAHDCTDVATFIDTDVPRYAQVMDQNRFDAVKKLEELRQTIASNKPDNSDAQQCTTGMPR